MTAKVRSCVTDVLILKIEKNVKSIEFDHNGVCPNGDKHLVILFQHSSQFCLCQCRQKVVVKNLSKWSASLSLFLFSKSKTALKLDKLGRSYSEKSFGIKCLHQLSCQIPTVDRVTEVF